MRARALHALIADEQAGAADPAGGPWARRCRWDPEPMVQRALIGSTARDLVIELSAQGADAQTRGLAALWVTAQPGKIELDTARSMAGAWLSDARRQEAWERPLLMLAAARAEATAGTANTATAGAANTAGAADPGVAAGLLRAWLERGDYPLEPGVFEAIARYGDASLAGSLAAGIPRAELEVRAFAAAALLALDADQAQPVMGGLIREASGGGDLAAAQLLDLIDALAALPGGGRARQDVATGWLRLVAAADPDLRDLSRAAQVARRAASPGGLRSMLRAEDDPELQRFAAEALRDALARDPTLRAPTLIAPLRALLASDRAPSRLAAAEALGGLGDTGVLTPLLEDSSERVRVAAAAALLRRPS